MNTSQAGTISRIETRTVVFDVYIDADISDINVPDTEYVIRVNGKIIKRMNAFQATRLLGIRERY
jgi:hypothetical protein